MYEMQGPRFGWAVQLVDCPDELDRWGNQRSSALSVLTNDQDAQRNPGYPVIPCSLKVPKGFP